MVYQLIQPVFHKNVSSDVNTKVAVEKGTFILCGK
jgi:hypothetical protein